MPAQGAQPGVGKLMEGGRPLALKRMAPQVGLEPTTLRLTAGCSAIELLRSVEWPHDARPPEKHSHHIKALRHRKAVRFEEKAFLSFSETIEKCSRS